MFFIQFLTRLFKILRSAASPNQIAGGFILGMIMGLTPLWSLHNLLVLILIIILNVNIATAILGFGVFSAFAYLFDPGFHSLGYYLLTDVPSLHELWTAMYNIPVIALSRFNNTVVMGSFVVSLLLLVPVFFLAKAFVFYYREHIDERLQKMKIVQAIKSSKFYGIYEKIRGGYERFG